jgi:hypothetical protein
VDVISSSYGGWWEAFATELHVGLMLRMGTAIPAFPHCALMACSRVKFNNKNNNNNNSDNKNGSKDNFIQLNS